MFEAGPVERDPEELHALIMSAGQGTRQARDIPGTTRRGRWNSEAGSSPLERARGVAMGRSL